MRSERGTKETRSWLGVVDGADSRPSVFSPSTSPPTDAMDAQKKLQALSDEFQQLQTGTAQWKLP